MTEDQAIAPQIFQPFPRQMLALMCPYDEILYGGAAGGGKTYWLGLDWSAHHATYGGKAKGLILRRTNPELEDLIRELRGMFETLPDAPKWLENKHIFQYPDGATLELSFLEAEQDVYRYQGRQWNWIGWDELTQHRKKFVWDYLGSRIRSANGVKTRKLATTNPGGHGHDWVMKHWKIDRFPRGMVPIRTYMDFESGKIIHDGEEPFHLDAQSDAELLAQKIQRTIRVFIPAELSDNPALDKDGQYRAELMNKPKALREALLEGRWDVVEGAHFPEWDPKVHVVRPFMVPKHWRRWMGGDWGTAKPYAIYWAAESPDGKVIVYRELYGAKSHDEPHKGTMEPASLVAQKIRAAERENGEHVLERYMDASCFSRDGHDLTIAQLFQKEGIHFQPSLKKNKAGGIANMREYLKVTNGLSRLAVFDTCSHLIRTLPALVSDSNNPELYDTKGEDHGPDALCYLLRRNTPDEDEQKKRSNRPEAPRYGEYGVW